MQSLTSRFVVLALAGVLTSIASAQNAAVDELNARSTVIVTSQDDDRVVEITLRDGEPAVKINGETIPSDRLRITGRKITILDEDGEPLEVLDVGFGPFDRNGFVFDTGGPFEWRRAMADALLQAQPEPPTVMIGVNMDASGPALESQLRLEPGATTLLSDVYAKLPADEAGLQQYDIIVSVDGMTPAGPEQVRKVLRERKAGDTLTLDILRGGEQMSVTVTLKAWDPDVMAQHGDFFFGTDLPAIELQLSPQWHMMLDDHGNALLRELDEQRQLRSFFDQEGNRRIGPQRDVFGTDDTPADQRIQRLEKQLEQLMERLNKVLDERGR